MALGVTQRLLLHQERSRCSVASTHAHRAPVTDHAGREQATQRHVGREIAVCVHDKVGIVTDRLHEGCVLGRPTQSVQNGTSLPALLRVLQLAIADEERDLLIDGLLQIDEPHIVITLLRHDFPRQPNAVVGTAVIHGQDVPSLPFLAVKEPLELNHLVPDKVLAVLVLCFGSDAVLFSVHREDARHVVWSALSEFQLRLGATHSGDQDRRCGRGILIHQLLDVLQREARGQDLGGNREHLCRLLIRRQITSDGKARIFRDERLCHRCKQQSDVEKLTVRVHRTQSA
mmetsp:Transcript_62892/g.166860  ORF Transcript_62892/g.166860 Transcript_62892/m.166860 type:complete len:287 (+) Transcript_62892:706-1566(+)